MSEIFNIPTGFHGTLISAFARLNLDHVVDEVNDETLDPWAELQSKAGISQSTPLTPYMEKEVLKDADLSMDGSAFEKETGFTYVTIPFLCSGQIASPTRRPATDLVPDTTWNRSPRKRSRKSLRATRRWAGGRSVPCHA